MDIVYILDLFYVPMLQDVGSLVYGWRPNGPSTWAEGGCFHPAYTMLDPYCPRVVPVVLPQVGPFAFYCTCLQYTAPFACVCSCQYNLASSLSQHRVILLGSTASDQVLH